MLHSITEAVGNGGLIEVPVPPHISRSHLTVYVDFAPTTAFEWVDDSKIRLVVPLNKVVRVVRNSSPGERLTDYKDGTVLGGDTLNIDSLQAFYLAQEARDIAILQGSAVGQPAPGTESTTAGLLALLTGQITVNQLVPSLAGTVNLITAGPDVPGSVNQRLSEEQQSRAQAIVAEQQARSAALQAEALARQAAITQEQQARQSFEASLTQQVTALTASVNGNASAIQSEQLARIDGDAALAQEIQTVQASLGEDIAEVRTLAESAVDGGNANANYTIKVTARTDGRLAVAGIGLNASAPEDGPVQSEIILTADQFFFVPSAAGINAPLTPLLSAGLVNGQPTTVFNGSLWGDQTMPARVIVDGSVEARHVKAGSLTVDKLDTRGIEIKDALGNVIFSAQENLDWTRIKNVQVTNAQIADIIESTTFQPGVAGWRFDKNGNVEINNLTARGDIRANSLTANTVTTDNLVANAVSRVAATFLSTVGSQNFNLPSFSFVNRESEILSVSIQADTTGTVCVDGVASFRANVEDNVAEGFLHLVVFRNGVQIGISSIEISRNGVEGAWWAAAQLTIAGLVDSPGPGTHTYALRIRITARTAAFRSFSWSSRGLRVQEFKR
ncbi:MAG: phage tail fiber protein [Aquabacterium sp.]